MNPVGRNQPCPCGSGKRFKACHGAPTPLGTQRPEPRDGATTAVLDAALSAQRDHRFEEARRLYREVLSHAPNHFDALHMLGVVHYQIGELEEARRYLDRANELLPGSRALRQNRRLVATALDCARTERELCREVLPRLTPLCAPSGELMTWLRSASTVHFVAYPLGALAGLRVCAGLRTLCAPVPVHPWCWHNEAPSAHGWKVLDIGFGTHPRGGMLVVCAGEKTMAHWIEAVAPDHVALMVTEDEPGQVIDRLREITLQGRRHAAVLYAAAQLAAAIGLPGTVVPEAALGAAA
jgi:tetratricopeptide (TPR) repeat protein